MNLTSQDHCGTSNPLLEPGVFLESIRAFLEELNPDYDVRTLQIHTNLVDEGLVDSFKVVELVMHVEESTGMRIDFENLSLKQVCSVAAILDTLQGGQL
jgi:acyl carrier protein